jgi:hypothetical protein
MGRVAPQACMKLKRSCAVLPLAIYSMFSLLYFGVATLPHLSQFYYGFGLDPTIQMWAMSWWPYAVAHRLNPLLTPAIWAPSGYNLARAVSIPGPSMIMYPVTRVFGPVAAYNLLCLICPPAAAYCTFLLCYYVCHRFWPALLGGYLFGFSQYVLSQSGGHLFLLFIFPVPLAVCLVLMRLKDDLSKYSFLVLFVPVLTFEFLSSTELFATTTVFGAMALEFCYLLFTELRTKLRGAIGQIVLGYTITLLMVSPYLYYVVARGMPPVANPAEAYSNDLLAFLVPMRVVAGGSLFTPISGRFRFGWVEMAAYLGPGVWLIFALFARSYWRTKHGRLLFLSFGVIALASLGPRLHIAGIEHGRLPWLIAAKLPLIDLALPGRFGMYLFLVAALISAIYLSRPEHPLWFRVLLGVGAVAFIFPDLAFTRKMASRVNMPAFFRCGKYRQYMSQGDIIVVLPNDKSNQALLWQAQTDFYFRLVTGFYIPPDEYPRWPITSSFVTSSNITNFSEQLDAFLGAHQVKAIIVDSSRPGPWPDMLSEAGMTSVASGGILFYRVPDQVLTSFHDSTPHQLAEKQAAAAFWALVIAANKYVSGGFPLASLSPGETQRLGLLPLRRGEVPPTGDSSWWQNLWLGSWDGLVGIGIVGKFEDLEFLVHYYRPEATDVFFPFPEKLGERQNQGYGQLLLCFKPEGLRRAASKTIAFNPGGPTRNIPSFKSGN